MFNSMQFADALAGAVSLLRASPVPGDEQKAALRRLVALAEQKSVTIRYYDGGLTVDDFPVPLFGDATVELVEQIKMHGVSEVVVGKGAEPAEILALVTGLCARGGQGRIKERLRDADSGRVMVILKRPSDVGIKRRAPSVTQAFERAQIEEAAKADWNKFLSSSADQAKDRDVDMTRTSGAARASQVEWPEPDGHMQPEPAQAAAEEAVVTPPPPPPSQPSIPSIPAIPATPPPPRVSRSTTAARRTSGAARVPRRSSGARKRAQLGLPKIKDPALAAALTAVAEDAYGATVLQKLTAVGKLVEGALREERVGDALRTLEMLIALESAAPSEADRSTYAVVLDRTLKANVLELLIPLMIDPRYNLIATIVLRRGRDAASDLLVARLSGSDTLAERCACLAALKGIPKGVDKALRLLRDSRWLVVRNVAEAMGELRVDAATPYLTGLQAHGDERVRRATIVALARIGSPSTVEPLRNTLQGGTPETRALIASTIGGPQAAALVRPITEWIEAENKPETVAEYCRALGRIGTKEAVDALLKAAAPGGMLMHRKSTSARLAAVEGLRLAGAASRGALEHLAADDDKAVREAAGKALAALSQ